MMTPSKYIKARLYCRLHVHEGAYTNIRSISIFQYKNWYQILKIVKSSRALSEYIHTNTAICAYMSVYIEILKISRLLIKIHGPEISMPGHLYLKLKDMVRIYSCQTTLAATRTWACIYKDSKYINVAD
jgi:hypothetical protein